MNKKDYVMDTIFGAAPEEKQVTIQEYAKSKGFSNFSKKVRASDVFQELNKTASEVKVPIGIWSFMISVCERYSIVFTGDGIPQCYFQPDADIEKFILSSIISNETAAIFFPGWEVGGSKTAEEFLEILQTGIKNELVRRINELQK